MALRYWVGGTGTWDNTSTTNWSTTSGGAGGASAPTTADDAIFDANSNTGTDDFTVTIGTGAACLTMVTTGIDPTNAMTVAGTGTLIVAGAAFTLTNKVSWAHTGTLSFASTTTGTKNITTAGVSLACAVSIAPSAAATYNFVDNFTTTGTFTHMRGTLNSTSSNKTLTVARFLTTGTSTKTIALGASAVVNITGNAATVFDLLTGTGITWTSPTAVNLTYAGSTGTRTVTLTSTVFAARRLNVSAGSDTFTSVAGNALDTLDFTGFTGTWTPVNTSLGTLTVSSGMTITATSGTVTFTRTGTFTTNGKTIPIDVTVNGSGITTTVSGDLTLDPADRLTLTAGTLAAGANNISVGRFQSNGTSTRALTQNVGAAFNITGNNATVFDCTVSFSTSVVFNCTYAGSVGTRQVSCDSTAVSINITAGSDIVSTQNATAFKSLDFTGFSGTWDGNDEGSLSITNNLTLTSSMSIVNMASTITQVGTGTWTTYGKVFDGDVTLDATASDTLTLADSLTLGTTRTFTLTEGTLALGANTLSAGQFSSSGTFTRAVTRSSGNITITGNAVTVLTLTGPGATYPSGLAFNCNYASNVGTRTFNVTATGPEIDISAGSDIVTFTASNSVGALDFTGFSGTWTNRGITLNSNLVVSSGMTVGAGTNTVTFSGTGAITSNGKTFDFPVTISGSGTTTLNDALTVGATQVTTLNQGTLALGANTLTTGVFTSSSSLTRAITRTTGNITVTGNSATVLTMTGSGSTYPTGLEVACSYAGSTGTRTINTSSPPSEINITAGSDTVTFTSGNAVASLDFTGFSGFWSNTTLSIFGDLTLSTGLTTGFGSGPVTFTGSADATVVTNGRTLNFPVTVQKTNPAQVTFSDALTVVDSWALTLLTGGLRTNNGATIGRFESNNTSTRTLDMQSTTWVVSASGTSWNCSNPTSFSVVNPGTVSMTSASAKTFEGGGLTWGTLRNAGAGALRIFGANTFTTIENTVQPTTFTFAPNITQTVTNFNVNGTSGNLVTINSFTAGSRATLSKASGSVSVAFCDIKDSNATGGASWVATSSVDSGNNTGWSFAIPGGGSFIAFFM